MCEMTKNKIYVLLNLVSIKHDINATPQATKSLALPAALTFNNFLLQYKYLI